MMVSWFRNYVLGEIFEEKRCIVDLVNGFFKILEKFYVRSLFYIKK